ncbi:MAG: hypothetical protein JWO50_819 [Candidatus Kaiserbacteria bacterium]|nr:hypothetical protein [Candidatus Kaiserbacteria bacterium]
MKTLHNTSKSLTSNTLQAFKTPLLLSAITAGALLIPTVFAFADVASSTTGTTTDTSVGTSTDTGMGSTTATSTTSSATSTDTGMGSTTDTGVGTTTTTGTGTSTDTGVGSTTTTGTGTTTGATTTTGVGSTTDMWTTLTTLQALLVQLQNIQQQILFILSNLNLGGMGGGTIPPTGSTTVTTGMVSPADTSVHIGGGLNFGGSQFGHEESVLVTLNGATVTQAHADGGGNFSTGSLNAPWTPGVYTYTFKGLTSNILGSATVTVTQ